MKKGFWLRLALGTGFLLGLLLLARTLLTYNYVAGRLLMDHLGQRAGDYIAQAQNAVHSGTSMDDRALQDILDDFLRDRDDVVASIGIYDQQGVPLAYSGHRLSTPLDQSTLDEILVSGSQRVIERSRVDDEAFLIVTTPFRFRRETGPPGEDWVPGRPRFLIAQIALYLSGASDAYAPLSNPWEAATREFEAVDFTFEVVLSAACFDQMKRHRMTTQLVQDYDPGLGYTYPPSFEETGLAEEFKRLYENTSATYNKLTEFHPLAAQYVLTNGHRRRMLVKVNAREIYHISRLREDIHAQWDIRQVASDMVELAREQAPLTLLLAFGKDVFEEKKKEILGT